MLGAGTDSRLSPKSVVSGGPASPSLSAPTVFLFLLASAPGSTFTGAVPGGVSAPSVFRQAARALGLGHLTSPRAAELAYALIAVACVGFVGVLFASRHGGISTRVVAGWSVALIALACVGPPLFSHDLFGYAIYGRLMVFHHANPYVQTPSVAPHDLFYPYNPWTHFRSPYGPAFTDISGGARLGFSIGRRNRCRIQDALRVCAGWPPCSWRQDSVVDGVRPRLASPPP